MQHHNGISSMSNANGHHSFISTSEDSYDQYNSHSRSASGTSQTPYDDFHVTPPRKSMVREYATPDVIMNGSRRISREYRKSLRARQSDPMAMHLLLETALGDSQHYDIMSLSELEERRKEEQMLIRKIHARKKKLYLEKRMHSTTQSLRRLDSHTRDGSIPDASPETNQKCDEIAEAIWTMEKRLAQLQNQRLQHTAGVLQLNNQLQLQSEDDGRRGTIDDAPEFDILSAFGSFGPSPEITSRLQRISSTLYDMVSSSSAGSNLDFPRPPEANVQTEEEVDYIEHGINTIRGLHDGYQTYLEDSRQKNRHHEQNSQQTHAVLGGLWDIIGAGEEDMRRNKQARQAEGTRGLDEEDDSDAELDVIEPYTLQAFSTKVQKLLNKAATLSEQQNSLRGQIQQERELQTHAETNRAAERSQLIDDLQTAHDKHLNSQRALEDTKAQLMEARGNLDQMRQEMSFMKQQHEQANSEGQSRGMELGNLRETISGHEATITSLRSDHAAVTEQARSVEARNVEHEQTISNLTSEHSSTRSKLEDMTAQLTIHTANLEAAQSRAVESEAAVNEKTRQLQEMENERTDLENDLVRLQTELTVSRAELDGAYGTRAQRAAEKARDPTVQKELEELAEKNIHLAQDNAGLSGRIAVLERELGEIVGAHEGMVRQLLEAEKDRDTSESNVDKLKAKLEELERSVSDEKIRLMGQEAAAAKAAESNETSSPTSVRSIGAPRAPMLDSTSIGAMRAEFKKIMRELRADHFRTLKAEQDERRRLEGVIRSLRKQGSTLPSSITQASSQASVEIGTASTTNQVVAA